MTAERILSDHLLRLRHPAIKPGAQIDRRQARKTFVPGARLIMSSPSSRAGPRDSAFLLTKASTLTWLPFGKVRVPTQSGRAFRLNRAGDSDAKQPPIPRQASRS